MILMKVRILFFARLRDLLGTESVELDSPDIESVGDAYRILLTRYPELEAFSRSLLVAVNQEFADWNTPVLEGDELALFPPVSGGQPPPDANYPTDGAGDIYQIVQEKIRTRGLVSQLTRDQDGAAVTFFGIVRNTPAGARPLTCITRLMSRWPFARCERLANPSGSAGRLDRWGWSTGWDGWRSEK